MLQAMWLLRLWLLATTRQTVILMTKKHRHHHHHHGGALRGQAAVDYGTNIHRRRWWIDAQALPGTFLPFTLKPLHLLTIKLEIVARALVP